VGNGQREKKKERIVYRWEWGKKKKRFINGDGKKI
jgi:hypothetical protein